VWSALSRKLLSAETAGQVSVSRFACQEIRWRADRRYITNQDLVYPISFLELTSGLAGNSGFTIQPDDAFAYPVNRKVYSPSSIVDYLTD
jgi:hypothetical protein